jgi:hypothetical protein
MISEWMKVMLEEISRKKAEAEQACVEEQRRADERRRLEERQRAEERQGAEEQKRVGEQRRGDEPIAAPRSGADRARG